MVFALDILRLIAALVLIILVLLGHSVTWFALVLVVIIVAGLIWSLWRFATGRP